MNNSEHECGLAWRTPWRSAIFGWLVAIFALVAGVPLFLCMPPWNDVTLHDMAARSILCGGVHYRDVFDTNLPGIDWSMAAIRWLFGWSYEVLRAIDLVVIGAAVAILCGWVRRCGVAHYTIAWLVAAAAMFYPFTSEFNHVQRDPWMLLPVVLATRLRLNQVQRGENGKPLFRLAILEGFIWGAAVWIKPHAIVPAFAVWLLSVWMLTRHASRTRIASDFAGLLLGGIIAGIPGVAWLIGTGAWPHFVDIFVNWNPSYLSKSGSISDRFHTMFSCFGSWCVLHYAAIPFALRALWEAWKWSRRPEEAMAAKTSLIYSSATNEQIAFTRALLATLYLAWLIQAVFVQKQFEYVFLPLTLLAMAVVASQQWCFGFAYFLWFIAIGAMMNVDSAWAKFQQHPLAYSDVRKMWPRCWREGGAPEVRDTLGQFTNAPWGTNWRELNDVATYLRTVEPPLGPGELNCWHDTTHPLYLMLNLDPATRYMHYGTAFGIQSKREVIAEEVRASRQRYVVSDLIRTTWKWKEVYDPASWRNGDGLPTWLPSKEREKFPWNQPVVFRSGRYLVHKIDPSKPLGVIRIPDWDKIDRIADE